MFLRVSSEEVNTALQPKDLVQRGEKGYIQIETPGWKQFDCVL